jgi:hypothetical protein
MKTKIVELWLYPDGMLTAKHEEGTKSLAVMIPRDMDFGGSKRKIALFGDDCFHVAYVASKNILNVWPWAKKLAESESLGLAWTVPARPMEYAGDLMMGVKITTPGVALKLPTNEPKPVAVKKAVGELPLAECDCGEVACDCWKKAI